MKLSLLWAIAGPGVFSSPASFISELKSPVQDHKYSLQHAAQVFHVPMFCQVAACKDLQVKELPLFSSPPQTTPV